MTILNLSTRIQRFTLACFGMLIILGACMVSPTGQKVQAQSVSELQAMIQQLMAQIAALSSSQSGTAGDSWNGKQVTTTAALRVRATPATNGQILRVVPVGSVGTVMAGPTRVGGISWYQVSFNTGVTGWVSGQWLRQTAQRQTVDVSSFVKISSSDFETQVESGDEDVPVAEIQVSPASFDRYVNRVVLEFTPDSDNEITRPWQAFEEISLWSRSWKVLEVDASNPRAWQKVGDSYQITIYTGNHKMVANREYELVAAVTVMEDVVPEGDAWDVQAPRGGVVIWSETNGHMTNARPMSPHETSPHMIWFAPVEVGPMVIEVIDTEAVTFGLNDSAARFEIDFEVIANDRDVYIKQKAYRDRERDSGVKYAVDGPGEGVISASLTSDADTIGRDVYVVPEGSSEDFTLFVTVTPKVPGFFKARLEGVSFSERTDGTTDLQHIEVIENNETDRVQLTVSQPSVTAVVNTATIGTQGQSRTASISGTAANSAEVVVFVAPFDYGSPSFETMRSQLGRDGVREATARVRNGRWAVGIPNIAPLSSDPVFFAWVYDRTSRSLLAKRELTRINTQTQTPTSSAPVTIVPTSTPPVRQPLPAPAWMRGSCVSGGVVTLSWAPVPGATRYYPRVRELPKTTCDAMGWNWNPANSHCTSNNYTGTEVTFPVTPGARYNAWVHAGDPYNPTPVHAPTFMCPVTSTTSPQHSLSFSVPVSGQIYRVGDQVTVSWTHQNLGSDQAVIQLQGTQGQGQHTLVSSTAIGNGSVTFRIPAFTSAGPVTSGVYNLVMFVRDVKDGSPKAVRATRSVTVINPGSGTDGQNNGGTGSEGSSDWNSSGGESGSSDSGSGAMRTPTRAVLGVSTDPYAEMLAALVAMQEYLQTLK